MYQAHFTWCWCPWWWWSGDDFNVSKYIVSVKCEPSNYGVFGLCVLLHKGSKQAGLSQCTGPWEQLDTKRAALLRECYISSQEISISTMSYGVSLVAQMVKKKKNVPAMQETWIWSLGGEDPLEKGMATHSSILAWRIPWTEESGGLQSMGCRVRYN